MKNSLWIPLVNVKLVKSGCGTVQLMVQKLLQHLNRKYSLSEVILVMPKLYEVSNPINAHEGRTSHTNLNKLWQIESRRNIFRTIKMGFTLEKQAAWISKIEGRSVYVHDWFSGFLARCLLRWRRRERKDEEGKRWKKMGLEVRTRDGTEKGRRGGQQRLNLR